MDAKYGTNPAVEFEWSGPERGDSPLVVSAASAPRSVVGLDDVELLDVLEYAFDPRPKPQLYSYAAEACDCDESEARERINELVESRVLLPAERVEERRNWFEHGWDLSLRYHLATRDWSFDGHADPSPRGDSDFDRPSGDAVELPAPDPVPDEPLGDVLLDRRTCREFDESSIGSGDLSSLLYHGLAPVRDADDGSDVSEALSYFDAEAFPLSVYPVVVRSEDLDRGLYRYRIDDHATYPLEDWSDETAEAVDDRLQNIVVNQPFIEGGSVTLLFAADLEAVQRQYDDAAALRHLYATVSAHAQRILFTATAFGFDAFQSAALKDGVVDELVGVDGYRRAVLYFMTIGREDE